jgi:hypothetical protein
MIDTLKKLRQKIVYTRYVVQVTAVFLIEDIKDYILKGRERHNTIDNDSSNTNSNNSSS